MNNIFFNQPFVPERAQREFLGRWLLVEKPTLAEFMVAVTNDPNKKWWSDMESIKQSYQEYLNGNFNARFPSGLFDYPHQVLQEVMAEVNDMISFNEHEITDKFDKSPVTDH